MQKIKSSLIENLRYEVNLYEILPKELIEQDEKLDIEGFCDDIHNEQSLFEFLHSIYERYTLKPQYWLLVLDKDRLIGRCLIYQRDIKFEDTILKHGGIGGLAVKKEFRNKGIGKELIKLSEGILQSNQRDFCLFAPISDSLHVFYSKLGYVELKQPYSYIGRSGNRYTQIGAMIKVFTNDERITKFLETGTPVDIGEYDY